jgi:hypothetical protein
MEIAFFLNFLFIILLSVFPVYYQSKFFKLGWVNPFTILFMVAIPIDLFKQFLGPLFLLEKGFLDPYFNFSLLMTNISLLMSCLMLVFLLNILKRTIFLKLLNKLQAYRFKIIRISRLGWLFLAVFFICFFLVASHSYGVINWITNPREGYQFHRSGAGHFYALSLSMLSVSFVLFTISVKKDISIIFIFSIFVYLVSLLGSKGFILSFFTYTLVILWFRRFRYLKILFVLGLPLVGLLLLSNYEKYDFASVAKYFDYYVKSAMYYEAYFSGEIDLFYGKLWITDYWRLVPRAYFPEKPYVYGLLHVNEYFYPGAAAATHTPAFGGPVASFADFGVIGVILTPIFNISSNFKILLTFLLYSNLYSNIDMKGILSNSKKIYLFMWLLAPSFLTFFPLPLNLLLFFLIVKTISIGNRIVVYKT